MSAVASRLRAGPSLHATSFVAETAVLEGEVRLAAFASVWYGAVARGDLEPISVGEGSNVQDLCVLHVDPGHPVWIGARVTVGHRAIVHGCTIEDDCLVGMGAIVLTGARIGAGSLVAAGALVREGQVVPPGSLAAGVPSRVLGEVSAEWRERILRNAESYRELAAAYREAGRGRPRP